MSEKNEELELAELMAKEYEESGNDLDLVMLARVAIKYFHDKEKNRI